MSTELGKSLARPSTPGASTPSSAHVRPAAGGSSRGGSALSDSAGSHKQTAKHEKKSDDFDPQASGHHTTLPAPPQAAHKDAVKTPSGSSQRTLRPSSGQGSTAAKAATAGAEAGKPNVFKRLGNLLRAAVTNPNKLYLGCLIAGGLCVAIGLATGNPMFTLLGIALVVGGFAGIANQEPNQGPTKEVQGSGRTPPQLPSTAAVDDDDDVSDSTKYNETFFKKEMEDSQKSESIASYLKGLHAAPLDEMQERHVKDEQRAHAEHEVDASRHAQRQGEAASTEARSPVSDRPSAQKKRSYRSPSYQPSLVSIPEHDSLHVPAHASTVKSRQRSQQTPSPVTQKTEQQVAGPSRSPSRDSELASSSPRQDAAATSQDQSVAAPIVPRSDAPRQSVLSPSDRQVSQNDAPKTPSNPLITEWIG